MATMPPKMTLNFQPPTPVKTRAHNKDQHPGAVAASKLHRSHAEMETICKEQATKKKISKEEKQKVLAHVAEIEDDLHCEDISRDATRQSSAIKANKDAIKRSQGPKRHGDCKELEGMEKTDAYSDIDKDCKPSTYIKHTICSPDVIRIQWPWTSRIMSLMKLIQPRLTSTKIVSNL